MLSGAWRARDVAEQRKQDAEKIAEELAERVLTLEAKLQAAAADAQRKHAQMVRTGVGGSVPETVAT